MEQVLEKRCVSHVSRNIERYGCLLLFLVGPYLEVGEFYVVRSRPNPRLRGDARKKKQKQKDRLKKTTSSATMTTVAQTTDETATHIASDVRTLLGVAIDHAFEYITAECARQHQM